MLKTSPVLTSSASPSPASLRHGHSHAHVNALSPSRPHTNAHARAHAHASHIHAHHSDDCATAAAAEGPIPRRSSSRSASSASLSASTSASMKSPAAASLRNMRNVAQSDSSSGVVSGQPARDLTAAQQLQQQNPHEPPLSTSPQSRIMNPQPNATTAATTMATTVTASPHAGAAAASVPLKTSSALSPVKRRGSPAEVPQANPTTTTTTNPTDGTLPKTSKRAKAEETPPKLLPQRYEYCAVADIVELIAHMIGELIATNDAIRPSNGGLTRFHSRTPPGISVRDYLHRLAKHATLTPPLLLAMVYYIDRLCLMYQQFTINTLTVHRFLITAATVAAKGLSDAFWNNATYARVGGVRLAELKLLELEFLHRVDWKIVPDPEVLVAYYRGLVERTPGYVLESDGTSDDDIADEDGEDESEVSG